MKTGSYNNDKCGGNKGALLNLQYNTCDTLDVNFNAYGNAIINEYSDHIDIYANNFDNKNTNLVTDTFKVNGCKFQPTYTAKDTGRNQTASQISDSYSNGTYILTVKHNGPVDITINCSGNNTDRKTNYNKTNVQSITQPSFYTGTRQYEGEFFDLKNCEGYVGNACGSGVTGVQGQGFLKFGKNANAAAKDTVTTQKAGEFTLKLRYSNTSDINNVDLYVNNNKVSTLKLSNTNGYSNWKTVEQKITLAAGENRVEFKANGTLSSSLYIDNFTVDGDFGDGGQDIVVNPPEPINGKLIQNLTVNDTANAADWSICYDFNAGSKVYGDRDITAVNAPTNLMNAEMIRTACDSKMYTGDLATFTANGDITVYIAVDTRVNGSLGWLKTWSRGGVSISTSNDVELELFKLNVSSGETVVLGTNGGEGNSANYIVFAVPQEKIIKGDINQDGRIDCFDMISARKGIAEGFDSTVKFDSADINNNSEYTISDIVLLQSFLLGKIKSFN